MAHRMAASGGMSKFYAPFANKSSEVMDYHMASDWCLPGLGDTGAHLSVIIDAGWTSYMLSHWYHSRTRYNII